MNQSFFKKDLLHILNNIPAEALERVQAAKNFEKLGIPTTKNEEWKYSNLKHFKLEEYDFFSNEILQKEEFESTALSKLEGTRLVFINGRFDRNLSDTCVEGKINILPLSEARKSRQSLINKHQGKYLSTETDGLTALNIATAEEGYFIELSANQTYEKPILIYHISKTTDQAITYSQRNLIVAQSNSEAKVIEILQAIGDQKVFENLSTEIFLDTEARLDYYKIQNLSDQSFHVGTTQVLQKDKSYIYSATITINGGFVRNNLNLVLDGEYINNHLFGLYLPNGTQHVDNHTLVDHQKPNSESNELYKGILGDQSKGVFNGKIFVRQDAQKTNAYQNCRNVILSDQASMNTKPQLEIWADDVKCSHGTSTGKLNDEAVFYMQSRGIPKAEAIRLQLLAFAGDVVSKLKIEDLRLALDQLIEEKLK